MHIMAIIEWNEVSPCLPAQKRPDLLFIIRYFATLVNKRMVLVGVVLGSLIILAFFAGSPMFGGFD